MTVHLQLIDFIDALLEVLEGATLVVLIAIIILLHKRVQRIESEYDHFTRVARVYTRLLERHFGTSAEVEAKQDHTGV